VSGWNGLGGEGFAWRKSSHSNDQGACVEVASGGGDAAVAVRDSTDPSGPVLAFPRGAWVSFLAGARAGEFDRP
jgi:hypothetical protein